MHSPSLLADLQLEAVKRETAIDRLEAFGAWLSHSAAGHVRRLSFDIDAGRGVRCGVFSTIAAASASCCAAGWLADLNITMPWRHNEAVCLGWVATLTSLTRLKLDLDDGAVDICESLEHLTRLLELDLGALQGWMEGMVAAY